MLLTTDDILYMSKQQKQQKELLDNFRDLFSFKVKRGIELQFLNFRIIQSEHVTFIDQTNHIRQSILNDYLIKMKK